MGHIFISYSHKDTEYAHALTENLQSMGISVWVDARLDYGSQWPLEIQKQLDSCDAFILIMTPRAFASDWVQSELQRAKRKTKPIFPLLLEGDEPWLSVESTQYYDVRDGSFPDVRFYSALKKAVEVGQNEKTWMRAPKGSPKTGDGKSQPKIKTEIWVAIIGAAVTIITACATIIFTPLVQKMLDASSGPDVPTFVATTDESFSPPSESNTNESPTDSASEDFTDSSGAPMRLVPAGEFTMGLSADTALEECLKYSSECQRDWFTDEEPSRQVYLDAYYMDVYEVSNSLYRACVKVGDCNEPSRTDSNTRADYFYNTEFDNYPVIHVSWEMAQTYCSWRDAQLPTEAQWEKAARGTDGRVYPWGDEVNSSYANYSVLGLEDTMEAGDFDAGISPYGLYNMAGNVWEWVADRYNDSYYQVSPLSNPTGPDEGQYHVLRGGSWYDLGYLLRTSVRGREDPEVIPDNGFGFRCARPVVP